MTKQPDEAQSVGDDARPDVGPDPVWGLGVFISGLLVMGVAGAFTWHWWFMIGEGFLLLGVVWFLTAVTITRLKQDPIPWRDKLPRFLGGTGEVTPEAETKVRAKTKAKLEAKLEAEVAPPRRKKKKTKKKRKKRRIKAEDDSDA